MIKILVSDNVSDKGIEILKKTKGIKVDIKKGIGPEELIACIGEYNGLIVRSRTNVTKNVINKAKNLKVIGRAGAGVDNIDIASASEKGIVVMNTPGGNTISATEHTMGMILALSRNIPQANSSLKNKNWKRKEFTGTEIFNKTLGIIGLGRIGMEVARRAQIFGMNIIAYDPFVSKENVQKIGIRSVSVKEIFTLSDYITLHVPLTDETKHLIGAKSLPLMKDGVRIINCARGGIVDEKALAKAIKSGHVAGAAIDVFEDEPPYKSAILGLDKVIVTPHLGASTKEAQVNVAKAIAEQFKSFFTKRIARNAVNLPSVSPEEMKALGPYLCLAQKLGRLQAQMAEKGATEISIEYSGQILDYSVIPLTLTLLASYLEPILGGEINFVNASLVAKERGIKVKESKVSKVENFTNLIQAEVGTKRAKNLIAGTVFGEKGFRLVKIGQFDLDVVPEGWMLFCYNLDRPGVVGKIGTILGTNKVNIAGMQVGRKTAGGLALTVINVDSSVKEKVLEKIKKIPEIKDVKMVKL